MANGFGAGAAGLVAGDALVTETSRAASWGAPSIKSDGLVAGRAGRPAGRDLSVMMQFSGFQGVA
jgi:hypothetical protein